MYEEARAHFNEKEIVDLTLTIVLINGWNRLSIAFLLGGAGVGGVDDVIHLDALGIDRVYIQAKCYDRKRRYFSQPSPRICGLA